MRKLMLLAGVAALSVSLPVVAKENQGRGNGGGQQAQQGHGGGNGNGQRGRGGGNGQANRGGGGDGGQALRGRGGGNGQADRGGGRQSVERGRGNEGRGNAGRGRGNDGRVERAAERQERRIERAMERQERQVERRADRGEGRRERADRQERRIERVRRDEQNVVREVRNQRREFRDQVREARRPQGRDWRGWNERRLIAADRFRDDLLSFSHGRNRGLAIRANGCPPGLAKQNTACLPPGQFRKAQLIGQSLPFSSLGYNVPDRYAYRFVDGDDWFYRYDDDGYVYQFDRDNGLVNSVYPLFGSDLYVGEPLPLGYEVYNLPLAYRPYYQDNSDHMYRYDDGAIYQVDSGSGLIDGIVALLTGGVGGLGGLGIGDMLPSGYDAYNVPLDYRDQYADSDDALYRYADGSIYEVDPQTRLIEEVISLIT